MGRFKLALALGFLLCLNLASVSSRPSYDEDEDDGFGSLFGDSEQEESKEAPPPPPPPPKAPEVEEDDDDDLWGASESKEEAPPPPPPKAPEVEEDDDDDLWGASESKEEAPPPPPAARALPPPPPVAAPKSPAVAEDDEDYLNWGTSEEDPKAEDKVDSHSHHHHHNHQDGQMKALNSPQQQLQAAQFGGGAAAPPPAPLAPAPLAPTWGSSIAAFNESCLVSTCNSESRLECDPIRKVCTCIDAYTYISSQERCFPIPTESNQDCEFNDQCHAARWGRLSRCQRSTARCECYDIDTSGKREMKRVAGVCHVLKNIYEPCSNTSECVTVNGAAICDFPDASVNPGQAQKQCRCDRGHIWDNRAKTCLPVRNELGSECTTDDQCMLGKLGELSRCTKDTTKCECYDPAKPGQDFVVFYKPTGRCFGRKDWNSTCREDDECRASISSKGVCLPDPEREEGSDDRTCQCPAGMVCPRDADEGDSGFIVSSSRLFTLTALVVALVYARP